MIKQEKYKNPIGITSQFPMCGNCFRVDTYRGCGFGCMYCFANNRSGNFTVQNQVADVGLISKWFHEAINRNDTSNIKKEMLNKYVPLHLGGMSDPFQQREFQHGATMKFLHISRKYNYPISISTKAAFLPDRYYEILDPKIHTFQISLMGLTDEYIRKFEFNTPSAKDRINFIRHLKNLGFWVSIRIQPLIDIDEACKLIVEVEDVVNYITIEHLKIPMDNKVMFNKLISVLGEKNFRLIPKGREYEFEGRVKNENIKRIKSMTDVACGCGDNDFHILSDSLNCCGVDLMPEAFKNWMKYNSMFIKMTGNKTEWYPKNNCNGCFNSTCIKNGFNNVKQYTDNYYHDLYGDDNQMKLF